MGTKQKNERKSSSYNTDSDKKLLLVAVGCELWSIQLSIYK